MGAKSFLLESAYPRAQLTSPRLRGEVEIRAQLEFRVRGTLRKHSPWRLPLTLTLSPQAGRGKDFGRF
jgi:hypothetical protein